MKKPTNVSLADELAELAAVLESAEMLADLLATDSMPDEESMARTPRLLAAVIELALGRLRLLRQVVRQQLNPSVLAGRRNTRAPNVERWEDPDIVLGPGRAPRRKGR